MYNWKHNVKWFINVVAIASSLKSRNLYAYIYMHNPLHTYLLFRSIKRSDSVVPCGHGQWDVEEIDELKRCFRAYLTLRICPSTKIVNEVVSHQSTKLLHRRNVASIRSKIRQLNAKCGESAVASRQTNKRNPHQRCPYKQCNRGAFLNWHATECKKVGSCNCESSVCGTRAVLRVMW